MTQLATAKTRARGHLKPLDQLMKIINILMFFRCCCGLSVANHTFPLFAPVPPLSESSPAESMSHSASGPQHQSSGGAGASTQGIYTIIEFHIKVYYSHSRPRASVIFFRILMAKVKAIETGIILLINQVVA